jgi:hypothetical protein
VKKSKIAQNSLPVPCSLFPVPLPQRQFLTPTYLDIPTKIYQLLNFQRLFSLEMQQ